MPEGREGLRGGGLALRGDKAFAYGREEGVVLIRGAVARCRAMAMAEWKLKASVLCEALKKKKKKITGFYLFTNKLFIFLFFYFFIYYHEWFSMGLRKPPVIIGAVSRWLIRTRNAPVNHCSVPRVLIAMPIIPPIMITF